MNGSPAAHNVDLIERAMVASTRQPLPPVAAQVNENTTPVGSGRGEPLRAVGSGAAPAPLRVDLESLHERGFVTPQGARTQISEAFRRIKRHVLANVLKPKPGAFVNHVMVTSTLPGEGKTFCAINLSISLAMETNRSVLLVDADTVKPSVLRTLGLDTNLPGLMNLLENHALEAASLIRSTNIANLSILPAGTPHPRATELLGSETMKRRVHELVGHEDRIVIFDSAPLLVASEAAAVAAHMSQILMVVAAGETTEAALKEALRHLEGCEAPIGMVLNKKTDFGADYGYYGYGHGHGYGASHGA